MEAQLQRIIEVQAEQNQLLRKQLRWLKVGLLALLLMVAVLFHGANILSSQLRRSNAVAAAPIIEYPISVAASDATQSPFPMKSVADQFVERIAAPSDGASAPIQLVFPTAVSDDGLKPPRGCDGMCM